MFAFLTEHKCRCQVLSNLAMQNLKVVTISNLPSYCISCTYKFVIIFVHQHLHVTVQIFYLSCHFHMALQQAIHRCLPKLCGKNQYGIESELEIKIDSGKRNTQSKHDRCAPCRKLRELFAFLLHRFKEQSFTINRIHQMQLLKPKEKPRGIDRTHERRNVVIGIKIREVNSLQRVAPHEARLGLRRARRARAIEAAQQLPQSLRLLILLLGRHLHNNSTARPSPSLFPSDRNATGSLWIPLLQCTPGQQTIGF